MKMEMDECRPSGKTLPAEGQKWEATWAPTEPQTRGENLSGPYCTLPVVGYFWDYLPGACLAY